MKRNKNNDVVNGGPPPKFKTEQGVVIQVPAKPKSKANLTIATTTAHREAGDGVTIKILQVTANGKRDTTLTVTVTDTDRTLVTLKLTGTEALALAGKLVAGLTSTHKEIAA